MTFPFKDKTMQKEYMLKRPDGSYEKITNPLGDAKEGAFWAFNLYMAITIWVLAQNHPEGPWYSAESGWWLLTYVALCVINLCAFALALAWMEGPQFKVIVLEGIARPLWTHLIYDLPVIAFLAYSSMWFLMFTYCLHIISLIMLYAKVDHYRKAGGLA